MACAARHSVCRVTEALPGSSRRSRAARLVFMRRAISTLLIFILAHRLLHLPCNHFFQSGCPCLFKNAFLSQEVIQRRANVGIFLLPGIPPHVPVMIHHLRMPAGAA